MSAQPWGPPPPPDRHQRFWNAIFRDATSGSTVDAVLRLADEDRADLQVRLDAAEALHRPTSAVTNPWCRADGQTWPCPTTIALRGEA